MDNTQKSHTNLKRGRPLGSTLPEEKKRQRVSMRFSPEVIQMIEQAIQDNDSKFGSNKTDFVEKAIRHYYNDAVGNKQFDNSNTDLKSATTDKQIQDPDFEFDFVDKTRLDWEQTGLWHNESYEVLARIIRTAHILNELDTQRISPYGINLNEFRLLVALRRNPSTGLQPSTLKKSLIVSAGAITKQVDHLSKLGLVKRISDSKDGRVVLICLTPKGIELINAVSTTNFARDKIEQLSTQEQTLLSSLLKKLLSILE